MTSSLAIPTPIDTASNAVRTEVEPGQSDDGPPAMTVAGLSIYAERHGDRVTGRVVYPYEVGGDLDEIDRAFREGDRITGRTKCPIDYRSTRPDATASPDASPSPPYQGGAGGGDVRTRLDTRARGRLDVVERYRQLITDNPGIAKRVLAKRAADAGGVSVRSVQLWTRQFEDQGVAGLRDRYVAPPARVASIPSGVASDAVRVCAWWSFRIGNVSVIDTAMMQIAAGLIEHGYKVADVLAVIDCYYAYRCDRARYPFKPFGRWCRYDLVNWVIRAASDADYARAVTESRQRTGRDGAAKPPSYRITEFDKSSVRGVSASPPYQGGAGGGDVAVQAEPDCVGAEHAERVPLLVIAMRKA